MSALKIEQAMNLAVSHHQAGRLAEAEPMYRNVLASEPNHAEALHLLGVLHGQTGRHELAVDLIRKAIAASPRNPAYHSNLGLSLMQLSHFDAAAQTFQQLIVLQPANADANYQLGNINFMKGALETAVGFYQRALVCFPQHFEALHNLGNVLVSLNQYDQAITICNRALQLNPMFPATHNNLGNAYKGKGNLSQAIASYQHALLLDPNYADASNNLGNTRQETKEFDQAVEAYRKAIALNPNNAEFHCNLGSALIALEQYDAALESLQHAVTLNPVYSMAFYNLGLVWNAKEKWATAIECFEKAIALNSDYFNAWLYLGLVYIDDSQLDKAMTALTRAQQLNADSPEVQNAIGIYWHRKGNLDQSILRHTRALELKPDYLQAHHNLANSLSEKGLPALAVKSYEQALALDPKHVKVMSSLAQAYKDTGQLDLALDYFQHAMELDPTYVNAVAGLASVYQDMGRIDKAIELNRKALEIDPTRMDLHEGLLFCLMYHTTSNHHIVREEHERWYRLHAQEFNEFIKPFTNDKNPARRLRIGYVSGDFRRHSVNHFIQPLLANHDKQSFEVYCYGNVKHSDAVTETIKTYIAGWRDIIALTDAEVTDLIREDKIDILIDLAGHTAYSRLRVFARKPAPVQVNYQGYAATTGFSTIDYRLTDPYADPVGMTDDQCTETLIRLPKTNWVYQPPPDAPAIDPTPALKTGTITFGSQNYFGKLSDTILTTWMQILAAVPASKLIIKSKGSTSTGSRSRIKHFADLHNITDDRIQLLDWIPPAEHYKHFGKIDISLDSYPYHGTTTTCETLWMGVPVIALAGTSHLSRVSVSLLTNLGLPQLIAQTPEECVKIAVELAGDIPRLAQLRNGMRQKMQSSPLMDYAGIARDIENAYRTMWQRWCEQQ